LVFEGACRCSSYRLVYGYPSLSFFLPIWFCLKSETSRSVLGEWIFWWVVCVCVFFWVLFCTDEDPEKAGAFPVVGLAVASVRSTPDQPVAGGGATKRGCFHGSETFFFCSAPSPCCFVELGSLPAIWSVSPFDREAKQRLGWSLRHRWKWGTQTAQQARPFGK